jgi:hypothetical protein
VFGIPRNAVRHHPGIAFALHRIPQTGFAFTTENPIASQAEINYVKTPITEIPPSQFQVKGGPLFPGVNGWPRTAYDANNHNFAPRVGVAYELNSRTVVRGGYGTFFIPYGLRFFANNFSAPGFDADTLSFSSLDNGLTFPNRLDNMFPNGLKQPVGSSLGLQTWLGQSLNLAATLIRDKPNAYNQRWEISLERQILSSWKAEVAYVGNHTADFRHKKLE